MLGLSGAIAGAIITGVIIAIITLITRCAIRNSLVNNTAKTDTPDKSEELVKITIYSLDGKELKTYLADANSIDTYPEGDVNFETKDGKRIILLTGNNLIEIKDL